MNYCVLLDCLANRAKPIQQVKDTGLLQTAYDLIGCTNVQLVPLYPDRLPKGYEAVTDGELWCRECSKIFNPLASWLYGCDDHGSPIMNNVVIFKLTEDEDDFDWMTEDEARKICDDLNARADEIFDLTMFKAMTAH